MATRVTRSQRADGTSENHELDRDEASVDTDSADVRAVESADPAVQVRVKELEIEALKLQIELQKLKLQSHASNEVGRSDRCGLARYADQLRAVLPPMPVSDELVPAWFRSAENMLRSCDIPDEVQGAIIVPFLNENSRTLVANRAEDRVLSYQEVRDLVLHELKLTPEEYKRRLYACRKGDETWGQFATRLEILLDYYLRSREISSVQELRALLISDRVKQLMREDMRTYVLQHETAEWLRPHDLAKLAQKYDESTSNRKSGKTANGSSKNGERFDRRTTDRLSQGNERTGVRCYACGESGHYRWQCSQTTIPPAEQGQDRVPTERLAARVACEPAVESIIPERCYAGVSRLTWIDLISAGRKFTACLDSGSDITVIRKALVPEGAKLQGVGRVSLRGAFGQAVPVDLMYVPLALHIPEGGITPELMELCAVTEKLAEGVDALLTPDTLKKLEQLQRNSRELAIHIVRAERNSAEEVDHEDEKSAQETPEHRQDSMGSRTGRVTANEAGNEIFVKEQREDSSLRLPWVQAREGTHGMFTEGELLFHRELLNGRQCYQLVLPETRRNEVLVLAHDVPSGGHFSGGKAKERVRSAFSWPTMAADIKKPCEPCLTCQKFANRKVADRVPIT